MVTNDGGLRRRLPGTTVALRACANEHCLALLFQRIERRIRIWQGDDSSACRVGQAAHAIIREEYPLERGQIVQQRDQVVQRFAWRQLDFRVIEQRAERLVLKRRETAVQLVSTCAIGVACPGYSGVGACEFYIVDARNHSPD